MAELILRDITKRFKGVTALRDISLKLSDGEFFVLLGPTGSGKTTTLRITAGLERQDSGTVMLDNSSIDRLSPSERDMAFVFEQYSLYPTMSVYDNLAFPLRSPLRRVPEQAIRSRIDKVVEMLRIGHLLKRTTAHLSGGEMQRVSLGRALVRNPQVFLMDEPLSNLDAKLRESLRVEIQHLQKSQQCTTLYVTHDQIEALTLADRIGVLDKGNIIQTGTPEDIYDRPANVSVARLVGTPRINLFKSQRINAGIQVVGSMMHPPASVMSALPGSLLLGIRPEDVLPCRDGFFGGEIGLVETLGPETILHIKTGEHTILSLVPGITKIRRGDTVRFDIRSERLHYFNTNGERINV